MRHRARRSLLDLVLLHHRPRTVVAAVALLATGLVTTSVVTASGPPDGTESAIEPPSYPGASYDPPTPSGRSSQEKTGPRGPRTSPSATERTTPSAVSRGADRSEEPLPTLTAVPDAPVADPASTPTGRATSAQPVAPDAPQTTATTRSANASRWVIGLGSDTGATYECSLDGGAYQPCGSTVTYEDLERGAHEFAARATDDAGSTDPSPATLTAEIGPRGQS